MTTGSIVGAVADAKAARDNRPVYEFTIPKKYANGISSIALVKLSLREEMAATERGKNSSRKVATEMIKASLIEVNGKRLDIANAEDDEVWATMDPQIRSFVLLAYGQLHNVEDEDAESFLASQKVRV